MCLINLNSLIIFFRLIFQIFRNVQIPRSCAEIFIFVVSKKYQSSGIGSKLINLAKFLSYKNGLKRIFTKTRNGRLFRYYKTVKKITLISKYKILWDTYYKFWWNVK